MKKQAISVIKTSARYWRFAASATLLLVFFILLFVYIAAYMRGETNTEVSGRAQLDFRVFYLENDIFEENPIPQNLYFLMSFTDYIEIDAIFSAWFEDGVQIYYSYAATEQLVIRYMATGDTNLNPIVFETNKALSHTNGNTFTRYIDSASNSNGIGGTYTIYPRPHIDTYLHFIASQSQQMYAENIITRGLRGFSAELFVDFSFTINVPELDFEQTVNHGYHLLLSTEVYSLIYTGQPMFTETISLVVLELPFRMTFFMVVFLAALFVLSTYCFFIGIRDLRADPNERKHEAESILKKYSGEIVVRDMPLNLRHYEIYRVEAFDELLKLAINLNKHVMAYHNYQLAEFAVVIDVVAYYYKVDFDIGDNEFDILNALMHATTEDAGLDF